MIELQSLITHHEKLITYYEQQIRASYAVIARLALLTSGQLQFEYSEDPQLQLELGV